MLFPRIIVMFIIKNILTNNIRPDSKRWHRLMKFLNFLYCRAQPSLLCWHWKVYLLYNYRFFFAAHIQNLYCDPSHLTQKKCECIVTHFSHFYDTELMDARYIVAYSNGRLEVKSSTLFDQYLFCAFKYLA